MNFIQKWLYYFSVQVNPFDCSPVDETYPTLYLPVVSYSLPQKPNIISFRKFLHNLEKQWNSTNELKTQIENHLITNQKKFISYYLVKHNKTQLEYVSRLNQYYLLSSESELNKKQIQEITNLPVQEASQVFDSTFSQKENNKEIAEFLLLLLYKHQEVTLQFLSIRLYENFDISLEQAEDLIIILVGSKILKFTKDKNPMFLPPEQTLGLKLFMVKIR